MIDLHSHILPNIDDGASSLAVTLAMLDDYRDMGFTTVVATPHWDAQPFGEYHDRIVSAFNEVVPHAEQRGITLLLGRECMLHPDAAILTWDAGLSLDSGRFLLVELPFATMPLFTDGVIFGLQAAGKVVMLAHPERYRFLQDDERIAANLVERGVLLQMNSGSLSGTFGKRARQTAENLLRAGLIHVIATDAHSNGARLQAARASLEVLRELVGEDEARRLTETNPGLILADRIPDPVRAQAPRQGRLARMLERLSLSPSR